MEIESLDRLGELAPDLRRGWSVPRVRRDYTRSPLAPVAYGVARYWRARLPGQAAARIRAGGCEAIMSHYLLASPRLVERRPQRRWHGLRLDGRRRARRSAGWRRWASTR